MPALDYLVGKWSTRGSIAGNSSSQVVSITGTDEYQRVLDGKFILHRANVQMGDQHVSVIELMGASDDDSNLYTLRSFDNNGEYASMEGRLDGDGTLHIIGNEMRSVLTIIENGAKMKASWERINNEGHWEHWMELEFERLPT